MRILSLPLAIASLAFAAVPHKFTAGTAAKADSVNANFEYLDNALKSKANQAGLDSLVSRVNSSPTVAGKASQGSVDTLKQLVSTKADTSELSAVKKSLSGLATTSSLTDALKLKANQAGLDSLVSRVNSSPSAAGKASQGSVDTLKQIVATKADMSEVSSIKTSISGLATTKALNDSLARISTDVTALKTGKADQSWVSSNFPMINASKELLAGDAVVVGSSATTGSTIRIEPGGLNNFGIWTTNGKGWSIQEDISDGSFQLHWFDGKQSGYTPFQVTPTGDITMGGSAKTVTVSSHLCKIRLKATG